MKCFASQSWSHSVIWFTVFSHGCPSGIQHCGCGSPQCSDTVSVGVHIAILQCPHLVGCAIQSFVELTAMVRGSTQMQRSRSVSRDFSAVRSDHSFSRPQWAVAPRKHNGVNVCQEISWLCNPIICSVGRDGPWLHANATESECVKRIVTQRCEACRPSKTPVKLQCRCLCRCLSSPHSLARCWRSWL